MRGSLNSIINPIKMKDLDYINTPSSIATKRSSTFFSKNFANNVQETKILNTRRTS